MPKDQGTDLLEKPFAVHLLDVGYKEYGDSVLCQFGEVSVLIDGAHTGDQKGSGSHRSIPDQIGRLLGQESQPYHVTLLIVSHAHEDHIGCLPYLVEHDLLRADWALVVDPRLGWGRTSDGPDYRIADDRVHQVVAGLREEVRTEGTDDKTLSEFLADAASLEQRYNQMIETLLGRETKVVRHVADDPKNLIDALREQNVELKILGPSDEQALLCAERIRSTTDEMLRHASDLYRGDDTLAPAAAYRGLIGSSTDAMDAAGRPGPAVNLQSIVALLTYLGRKFLFAGDMQLWEPQVPGSEEPMHQLRERIQQEAPFDFSKLSHHGSYNAFSEEILQEFGATSLFGICAGESSKHHPNPGTLEVLKQHQEEIRWARTDHNRESSFFFNEDPPSYQLERGKINDWRPNTPDEAIAVPTGSTKMPSASQRIGPPAPRQVGTSAPSIPSPLAVPSIVEVAAKVPHTPTRVTITIDVQPQSGGSYPAVSSYTSQPDPGLPSLNIAGGRPLPPLLFVTSKQALIANIGASETQHLLASMRGQGLLVFDEVPGGLTDAASAAKLVREKLNANSHVEGVVIIGGYDVVPAQVVDCLPPQLRSRLRQNGDADNFIVWSDDVYGDQDGDGLPELPVSRIPDGKSAQLVFAAVQAPGSSRGVPRLGVRNVRRPFAQPIYSMLPGNNQMALSKPTTFDQTPHLELLAERVYLMLHGDYTDSSRFWGEDTDSNREAINLSNVPETCGPVVFTGCCWGALTVSSPAGRLVGGRSVGQKTAEESFALAFLLRGVVAFIGCTGSHYSPLEWPYRFFGGPLHEAFWRFYEPGKSPAEALFASKLQYLRGFPHGQNTPTAQAIEYKIWRQYTCLGLGW